MKKLMICLIMVLGIFALSTSFAGGENSHDPGGDFIAYQDYFANIDFVGTGDFFNTYFLSFK